ncbi:MAG: hypothetical protein BGO14_11370 [Chlamydiales bacterium 38-26]|nr:hypothetical protein [Chlamydiales bacterium]OJV11546.1 MAG: hypothetical protein BGO14_11370 [Chlamydiales bacterium 38-26]
MSISLKISSSEIPSYQPAKYEDPSVLDDELRFILVEEDIFQAKEIFENYLSKNPDASTAELILAALLLYENVPESVWKAQKIYEQMKRSDDPVLAALAEFGLFQITHLEHEDVRATQLWKNLPACLENTSFEVFIQYIKARQLFKQQVEEQGGNALVYCERSLQVLLTLEKANIEWTDDRLVVYEKLLKTHFPFQVLKNKIHILKGQLNLLCAQEKFKPRHAEMYDEFYCRAFVDFQAVINCATDKKILLKAKLWMANLHLASEGVFDKITFREDSKEARKKVFQYLQEVLSDEKADIKIKNSAWISKSELLLKTSRNIANLMHDVCFDCELVIKNYSDKQQLIQAQLYKAIALYNLNSPPEEGIKLLNAIISQSKDVGILAQAYYYLGLCEPDQALDQFLCAYLLAKGTLKGRVLELLEVDRLTLIKKYFEAFHLLEQQYTLKIENIWDTDLFGISLIRFFQDLCHVDALNKTQSIVLEIISHLVSTLHPNLLFYFEDSSLSPQERMALYNKLGAYCLHIARDNPHLDYSTQVNLLLNVHEYADIYPEALNELILLEYNRAVKEKASCHLAYKAVELYLNKAENYIKYCKRKGPSVELLQSTLSYKEDWKKMAKEEKRKRSREEDMNLRPLKRSKLTPEVPNEKGLPSSY